MSSIDWAGALRALLAGRDLDEEAAAGLMRGLMSGEADPAQTAGLLVALRAKGETSSEIAGFVRAMLDHAAPIQVEGPLLDTCGTGGDGLGTLNVSTIAALIAAAAGARVAKHGNRAASGTSGSADLLEAWGLRIELSAEDVATTINELGIGFLFARSFHPAMRHVAAVRVALGVPTVFNILGPLSNPAGATHQVVGVADARLAPIVADALARLGTTHALVFRGDDGIDELSTTGPSRVWEVRAGEVGEEVIDPGQLGLEPTTLDTYRVGSLDEAVAAADAVLAGEPGPRTDLVLLNAGAALYAADLVGSIADGLARARKVLQSGVPRELRDRWVARSQELALDSQGG